MSNKQLNLFDLAMIVVSLVIGMGIFRTPVVAAARAGTPLLFFLAWLIGGVIALCGALTYAGQRRDSVVSIWVSSWLVAAVGLFVVIRIHPEKWASWDHSKLAGAAAAGPIAKGKR